MKILFIHQNFPGQFRSLAPYMSKRGHEIGILMDSKNKGDRTFPSFLKTFTYEPPAGAGPATHHYLKPFETNVRRAQVVFKALIEMKKTFTPDIVVGHTGWGELMYVKEALPNSKVLGFSEYFYQPRMADIGFDAEFPNTFDDLLKTTSRNLVNWQTFHSIDWNLMPTAWQASTHPKSFLERSTVIFDGVDTINLKPNPDAIFEIGKHKFTAKDEIITFINRNFEPYRGFHVFYRALPEILKRRPNAHVLMIGGGGVSYGAGPKGGGTWREKLEAEVGSLIPQERVHWSGRIEYDKLISALQISKAHIYLTYPFVQSWSMVEAMGLGALVIGSKTSPVQEFIEHGKTGLLFDFFNKEQLTDQVCEVLEHPKKYEQIRINARAFISKNYDIKTICLPKQAELIESVFKSGEAPAAWETAVEVVRRQTLKDDNIKKLALLGRVLKVNESLGADTKNSATKNANSNLTVFKPTPVKADMLVRMCSFVPAFMEVRTVKPMQALAQIDGVRAEMAEKIIPFGIDPNILNEGAAKILVIQRHIPPPGNQWIEAIKKLHDAGWLVVTEWDDHPDKLPGEVRQRFGEHGWLAFKGAHAVQTSTQFLANELAKYNPNIAVFPNSVSDVNLNKLPRINPRKFFFGALNRRNDWKSIIDQINQVEKEFPELEWEIVWDKEFYDKLKFKNKKFYEALPYENYLKIMSGCDIALLPLEENFTNNCKSDIKYLEASSQGVAVIASKTVYENSIGNNKNRGIVVENNKWKEAIEEAIKNPNMAKNMVKNARQYIVSERLQIEEAYQRVAQYKKWWSMRDDLYAQFIERIKTS
jgi:glycosyltransferase involved in cell wall biosynthesis